MPRTKRSRLTARTADRHALYEQAVQDTELDVRLIDRVYRREHGRPARDLREDFCGTAALCASWVKRGPDRTALGVDLDAGTLEWGLAHNIRPLGPAAERVTLVQKNVLDVTRPKVDLVVAFNFSYCVLLDRRTLVEYLRQVRRSLRPGGCFVLDNHSGGDTLSVSTDERDCDDFTYVWEQCPVNGVDNVGRRKIHFHFPDGSTLRNAFTYDWRVWSLAEVRDAAVDAGFHRFDVYADYFNGDGEPTTPIRKVRRYEHEQSWTPYLVCWR